MSNHHINRRSYSTNVRALNFKRKAVETLITLLWHLAPVFTLHKVADLFFAPARPRLSSDQSRMIAQYEQRFGYDLNRDDPLRLLSRFNAPVLIIYDRDDRIVPFRDSKAAAANNRHVRLHPTEGLGHKGVLTDPGVAAAALDHLGRPQTKEQ